MRKIMNLSGSCLALLFISQGTIHAQKAKTTVKATAASGAVAVPVLSNFNDTVSYALGLSLAKFYQQQGATSINENLLAQAVSSVFKNDSALFSDQQVASILMQADQRFTEEKAASAKKEGAAFLAKNKTRPGVTTLPDGLQYEVMKVGTGAVPTDTSNVKVNYRGMLISGAEFDNSYKRGEPIDLDVTQVIKGWTEVLKLMHEGAKWKIYVPSDLAYGDRGAGGTIPPGATLIFEIELLKINH